MLAFKSSVLKNVGTIYNAINRTLKLVKNTWTHFNLYLIFSVFLKIIRKWKVHTKFCHTLTRDPGKLKLVSWSLHCPRPTVESPHRKCFHPIIRPDVSPHFSSRWISIHFCPFCCLSPCCQNHDWTLHCIGDSITDILCAMFS